jgi:uncharacterized membrane protein YsdA (DUF1294 family)
MVNIFRHKTSKVEFDLQVMLGILARLRHFAFAAE